MTQTVLAMFNCREINGEYFLREARGNNRPLQTALCFPTLPLLACVLAGFRARSRREGLLTVLAHRAQDMTIRCFEGQHDSYLQLAIFWGVVYPLGAWPGTGAYPARMCARRPTETRCFIGCLHARA